MWKNIKNFLKQIFFFIKKNSKNDKIVKTPITLKEEIKDKKIVIKQPGIKTNYRKKLNYS